MDDAGLRDGIAKAAFATSLLLMATLPALAAGEPGNAFDGRWDVTLTCPPHNGDEDAKGYTHRFPAVVANGAFRGTHGSEGEPSWHLLTGTIGADGSAAMKLEGIVNNPDYSVGHAYRGKPYTYRVRAKFEATNGSGERIGKRKCDFRLKRV